jgi:putative ABC transport system permease protein
LKKEFLGAMVMGIAPTDLAQVTDMESGTLPRSGSEVVVGALTAMQKNIKPGSMITFVKKNPGGEDEEFPVRVVGVLQMTNRWDIFVDNAIIPYEPWLRENSDFKGYDQVLVKLSNVSEMNTTMKAVSDELNRRTPEITLNNFNELRDRFLSEMEQKAATTTAIAGISLVVAGVSIFNVMVMSVMERYREIGVLRSIGTRRGSILFMFIYESLLLGFIGSGIGGALSLVLGYLYADMIGAMNYFTAPATLMQIPYAMSFGIAISLVSGLYPALKASRLNPIEALRYE